MLNLRRPAIALLLALSLQVPAPVAQAEDDIPLFQVMEKIGVAGRQRMLAQRMAGLSCLVHLGIDARTHAAEALEAQQAFAAALEDLRTGNPEAEIPRETDPETLILLSETVLPFNIIRGYMTVLTTTGEIDKPRLEAIANAADTLFEASDAVRNRVQVSQGEALAELPQIQAMILNISDRQRMLSEKAFKEFCLSQAGVETAANQQALATTIADFDATMRALVTGLPGLVPLPPTAEIRGKLEETLAAWRPIMSRLEQAAQGQHLTAEEIHDITEDLESVRMLMDDAMALYMLYQEVSS